MVASNELLDASRGRSAADWRALKNPLLGFAAVANENRAEGLCSRLLEHRIAGTPDPAAPR